MKYKIGQMLRHIDTAERFEFVGWRQNRVKCRHEDGRVVSYPPREVTTGRVLEAGERRRRDRVRSAQYRRRKNTGYIADLDEAFKVLELACHTITVRNRYGMKWRLSYSGHGYSIRLRCCSTKQLIVSGRGPILTDAINRALKKLAIS